MAEPVIEVKSSEQFRQVLSQDLHRVSVINFWAAFAEPCKQMDEVDAEEQPDISDSFDIGVVPSFIVLRGHTLLSRIDGANVPALSNAVAKNVATPSDMASTNQASVAPPLSYVLLPLLPPYH
ncbi:hypothetical protein H1R20_g1998, partial [Candolleomyces eurysporus]